MKSADSSTALAACLYPTLCKSIVRYFLIILFVNVSRPIRYNDITVNDIRIISLISHGLLFGSSIFDKSKGKGELVFFE